MSDGKSSHDATLIEDDEMPVCSSPNTTRDEGVDSKPAAVSEQVPSSPSKKIKLDDKAHVSDCATRDTSSSLSINHKPQQCMLHPECPIKLFATKQDEELRKENINNKHNHWSYTQCWTLREMIGVDGDLQESAIDWIAISTFIIDFDFLLEEIPELLSISTVLVVYGSNDSSPDRWKEYSKQPDGSCSVDFLQLDPSAPKQSPLNPLKVQMNWGCHHTKFFLVGFSSGRLRVIVHTSNMRWNDVHLKCQGAYIQDFLPSANTKSSNKNNNSEFGDTLVSYLETYNYHKTRKWGRQGQQHSASACSLVECMRRYDFSTAKGILIPSTPGYHKPRQLHLQGYLKVRQAILKAVPKPFSSSPMNPIVCQFSSIGSLSQKYLQNVWTAWDVASVHRIAVESTKDDDVAVSSSIPNPRRQQKEKQEQKMYYFKLVYPTVQEILHSVEGVDGGGSVPGRSNNVQKKFLLPLYHKWTTTSSNDSSSSSVDNNATLNKGQHVPHIKTYYQMDDDQKGMQWFVLSSQNLSKAAWGELQHGQWGETFKVFHWELGVFLSPETLGAKRIIPFHSECSNKNPEKSDKGTIAIPLPYKFVPQPYGPNDHPWTVDGI